MLSQTRIWHYINLDISNALLTPPFLSSAVAIKMVLNLSYFLPNKLIFLRIKFAGIHLTAPSQICKISVKFSDKFKPLRIYDYL